MTVPLITFLSDYGHDDEFVGVCHAVIAGICPEARVIDLTHGIPRHDVRAGALVLRSALPYLPSGIHLAVVDPDVGAERRAVAIRAADDRLLIGPDNGLLSLAAQLAGGVVEAVDIARSPFRLEPVSATFHGRDIFAPVAARLAAGAALAEAGEPCDPDQLVSLELPRPRLEDGTLIARVVYIDRFGNVALGVEHDELADTGLKLGRPVELEVGTGTTHQAHFARTFADVGPGELMLYEDAQHRLAVAVSHGSAGTHLGVSVDDELRITPE
jgi:S-adenosylmethionine hydrolase